MRVFSALLACSVLAACSGSSEGSTTDHTDASEPRVCDAAALVDGLWTAEGSPFGMPMDATVTFDDADCSFATTDWNYAGMPMSHSSMMWGGLVDGEQVQVFGSTEFWDSCTGSIDADGTHMSGVCTDAATGKDTWELTLKPE